jgi:hypothetical protein
VRGTASILAAAALGLALGLPALTPSAVAAGSASRPDIMPVKDIKPKMKGYGLTVFEGTKPERFEVEIIDVLENFRPRQDLILIKTKHPRLEIAKVVAGMSGSPCYIDGKMIGAYAYGWTFGSEPVAGVTPIQAMLDDLARPLPDDIFGWPLRPGAGGARQKVSKADAVKGRFAGAPESYSVMTHAGQLADKYKKVANIDSSPLVPVATPVLLGGMTSDAIAATRDILAPLGLEPMQAGGGGATKPGAPTRYEDGGAIGVQLVRGDMSAMGIGTVTRVEGDKLVAFGHPMMEVGVTALPTAIGQVHWFLASEMRSFKLGSAVRPLGALLNDRQASIVVSQTAQAPIIPTHVRINGEPGAPYTDWNFEVAHDKFMTPAFLGIALGSALQAAAAERRDVSWMATSKVWIKGYGEVTLVDYGASPMGTPQTPEIMRSNLVRAAGGVLNNPWQEALIEKVDFQIDLRFARDILRLRGAQVLDPELDPGEPARIRLTLEPFAGPVQTRVITVPIPARFAGETIELKVQPGYMVEKERAAPETLAELISNLEDPIYPARSIVVSFSSGSGGVAYRGHVAQNLPPGALDSFATIHDSIVPIQFGSQLRHVVASPDFLVGDDSVSITVRPALR